MLFVVGCCREGGCSPRPTPQRSQCWPGHPSPGSCSASSQILLSGPPCPFLFPSHPVPSLSTNRPYPFPSALLCLPRCPWEMPLSTFSMHMPKVRCPLFTFIGPTWPPLTLPRGLFSQTGPRPRTPREVPPPHPPPIALTPHRTVARRFLPCLCEP